MFKFFVILSLLLTVTGQTENSLAQQTDPENTTYILGIAWSPDGERLAVAGAHPPGSSDTGHGYLSVIDGITGNTVFTIEPQSAFTSVAWSPDGQRLALGSYDGTVWIMDALTGERITNLFGHAATVTDIDWSSDGSRIVSSGNWDERMILWNVEDYSLVSQFETIGHPHTVEFSPDDLSIVFGTETGLYVFSVSDRGTTRVTQDYRILTDWLYHIAFSHDGRFLAVGSVAQVSLISGQRDNARLYILDASTWEIIHRLESSLGSIGGLSWSMDNRLLAVLNEDGIMTLWDIESSAITASYPSLGIDRYDQGGVAYSPFGGRLAFSNWLNPDASQLQPSIEEVSPLGDGAVQIIVPNPSFERLNAIVDMCVQEDQASLAAVQELAAQSVNLPDELPDFIVQIEALPEDAIPPACRADLLAVAEAIIAQQ